MEMADKLGTLPRYQQIKVMERVFQKMSLAFGSAMQAKWQGIDQNAIFDDWADAMKSVSIGAINHGTEESKRGKFPPNQAEFIERCHTYQPPPMTGIENHTQPISKEKALENISRLKTMLAQSKIGGAE